MSNGEIIVVTTYGRGKTVDCNAKGTYPAPWGETKGMYPETYSLPKQHTPSACGGVVDMGFSPEKTPASL